MSPDDFYIVGQFDMHAALFGNGPYDQMPLWENLTPDRKVSRSDEKTQPSEGQEDFAADGDPFNDGEAPTRDTVESWLQNLLADASNPGDGYFIVQDAGDGPTTYQGAYTIDGQTTEFYSDGNGHYGQQPSAPPMPATGGLDFGDDFFWF